MIDNYQNVPELRFNEFKNNWKNKKIKDISSLVTKGTTPKNFSNEGINFIKVENINNNNISNINSWIDVETHENDLSRSILEKDDLLFSIAGVYIGKTAKVTEDLLPANTNQALAIIRIMNFDYVNADFLHLRLNCEDIKKYIFQNLVVGAQPNLNLKQIENIKISLPSYSEQLKISNFIKLIEKKIELMEKRLLLYQKFKKQIIQDLTEYNNQNHWKKYKLNELLKECSEKSTINNQFPVLSSTKDGIKLQEDYFNKNIASTNNVGYKIIHKNQLVLSPQNLWLGNININEAFEIGLVSPSYKIYDLTEKIDMYFLKHIIKKPKMIYLYKTVSEQGASVVRRNLNKELFENLEIFLPPKSEQEEIGLFLNTIDKKIKSITFQRDETILFKKALLQKMFV